MSGWKAETFVVKRQEKKNNSTEMLPLYVCMQHGLHMSMYIRTLHIIYAYNELK